MHNLIDGSGAVVGAADYSAFGKYRNQTGVTSRFGFTGEYYAQETGMWHLRARDLHPSLGRFLSADPVQPNAPGTQGYNRYAYVANNPTTWVDPSGYSVEPLAADQALLGMMYAMHRSLHAVLRCALSEECRDLQALMKKLGSRGANFMVWTAEELQNALFSTYPHQPTPVDPGMLVFSIGLSNTPIIGDLYDLYTGVTGYDPITGQYLAGWERLANIAGAIPILGLSGANIRHGVHAAESLIDNGDELAQFIGKACSFDEDTPVATSEGSIPIREIDVGDQVLAWNETIGATGYYTVTAVWRHEDPATVQLVINGETIDTTPEHPFLTTDGTWVMAGELTSGDRVRSATSDVGVVDMVTFVTVHQQMYNLTVADAHTYVVGDGEWVVHNSCFQGRALANTAKSAHKRLPPHLKQTTVAAARNNNGELWLSVYGKGDVEAVEKLREMGYNVLPAQPFGGFTAHAERQLYDNGFRDDIGISGATMCPTCQGFFSGVSDVIVTPYSKSR